MAATEESGGATKPLLRGVLHQWAAACALGGGVVLVSMARSGRTAAAAAVFALSLFTLFTVSAVYHRVTWSPRARAWMRRADHASIFVLIAGTYTPIALLGMPEEVGNRLTLWVWTGAALGILQSLFWIRAPKVVVAVLAVAVGWTIVPYLGVAWRELGPLKMALIAAGGLAYTLGAGVYAAKRPNPKPGVFGYHELFHLLTIVAAVLHFCAVVLTVRAAAH